jgi:hypothetical protein
MGRERVTDILILTPSILSLLENLQVSLFLLQSLHSVLYWETLKLTLKEKFLKEFYHLSQRIIKVIYMQSQETIN